jgi:hypothetical protein
MATFSNGIGLLCGSSKWVGICHASFNIRNSRYTALPGIGTTG